jgi:hypothetical protein
MVAAAIILEARDELSMLIPANSMAPNSGQTCKRGAALMEDGGLRTGLLPTILKTRKGSRVGGEVALSWWGQEQVLGKGRTHIRVRRGPEGFFPE